MHSAVTLCFSVGSSSGTPSAPPPSEPAASGSAAPPPTQPTAQPEAKPSSLKEFVLRRKTIHYLVNSSTFAHGRCSLFVADEHLAVIQRSGIRTSFQRCGHFVHSVPQGMQCSLPESVRRAVSCAWRPITNWHLVYNKGGHEQRIRFSNENAENRTFTCTRCRIS